MNKQIALWSIALLGLVIALGSGAELIKRSASVALVGPLIEAVREREKSESRANRWRDYCDALPAGAVLAHAQGEGHDARLIISEVNEWLCVRTGWTHGDLIGESINKLVPSKFHKTHTKKDAMWRTAQPDGRFSLVPPEIGGAFVNSEGVEFPARIYVTANRNEEGRPQYLCLILADGWVDERSLPKGYKP